MPANVAHMLICNKAVKVFQDGGEWKLGTGSVWIIQGHSVILRLD